MIYFRHAISYNSLTSLPTELKQLNLVYQESYSHAHGNFIDCDFYKHHLSDRIQSWYCNQTTQQSLLNLCIISTTSLHMNKYLFMKNVHHLPMEVAAASVCAKPSTVHAQSNVERDTARETGIAIRTTTQQTCAVMITMMRHCY